MSRIGPNNRQRRALEDQEREQAMVGILLDRMARRVSRLAIQLETNAVRLNQIPNRNFLIRLTAINNFMGMHLGMKMLDGLMSKIPDEDKNLMPTWRWPNVSVQLSTRGTMTDMRGPQEPDEDPIEEPNQPERGNEESEPPELPCEAGPELKRK